MIAVHGRSSSSPRSAAAANRSAAARSCGPSPSASARARSPSPSAEPSAGERAARLHALGGQRRRQSLGARRLEAHELAARGDGRQNLPGSAGQQDQVDEVGRLLQRLQHPVGGRVAHRVGLLDHEHAPPRLERRPRRRRYDRLVDVRHQHLGGAARRDPGQVGVRAALHALGDVGACGRAVSKQRRREGAGDGPLAGARRPGEQVGVRCTARRQRRRQQRLGVRVAFDPRQRGGARSAHDDPA